MRAVTSRSRTLMLVVAGLVLVVGATAAALTPRGWERLPSGLMVHHGEYDAPVPSEAQVATAGTGPATTTPGTLSVVANEVVDYPDPHIRSTRPDEVNGRVIVTVDELSADLAEHLVATYGTDLVAVEVDADQPLLRLMIPG